MIKTLVKAVVFSAAVLLLGQVRVGNTTLGARFHGLVVGTLHKGGELLQRSKLLAKVTHGIGATSPVAPKEAAPAEGLSDADRESLRKLLQ